MKLFIVVPCYNVEAAIPVFLSTVVPILASGDAIIPMGCDLQDPPGLINLMRKGNL